MSGYRRTARSYDDKGDTQSRQRSRSPFKGEERRDYDRDRYKSRPYDRDRESGRRHDRAGDDKYRREDRDSGRGRARVEDDKYRREDRERDSYGTREKYRDSRSRYDYHDRDRNLDAKESRDRRHDYKNDRDSGKRDKSRNERDYDSRDRRDRDTDHTSRRDEPRTKTEPSKSNRKPEEEEGNNNNENESEEDMMAKMMGFSSFNTTKDKKVAGTNVGSVAKPKASNFRQYMYVTTLILVSIANNLGTELEDLTATFRHRQSRVKSSGRFFCHSSCCILLVSSKDFDLGLFLSTDFEQDEHCRRMPNSPR